MTISELVSTTRDLTSAIRTAERGWDYDRVTGRPTLGDPVEAAQRVDQLTRQLLQESRRHVKIANTAPFTAPAEIHDFEAAKALLANGSVN